MERSSPAVITHFVATGEQTAHITPLPADRPMSNVPLLNRTCVLMWGSLRMHALESAGTGLDMNK